MALLRGLCSKVGQSVLQAERLLQRKLIVVRGLESSEFLQGLVTNDVGHLGRGNSSIYAMFLNKGGRVLYDTIIYKTPKEEDSFLLECDSAVADQLVKHLKMYRVRRKIDIERTDEKQVWVVFDGGSVKLPKKIDTDKVICTDPRLKNLGTRIVTSASDDMSHISSIFEEAQEASEGSYRKHRYDLGIGEGVVDLPREKSFPLEANVDFLNGVSFHKGCYVGQELTARTHHTGVVRKRLMPLRLKQPLEVVESADLEVQNEQGQNVGKLRGHLDGIGLALLRIEPAMAAQKVIIAGTGVECEPYKPGWWPTSDPQNLKHVR